MRSARSHRLHLGAGSRNVVACAQLFHSLYHELGVDALGNYYRSDGGASLLLHALFRIRVHLLCPDQGGCRGLGRRVESFHHTLDKGFQDLRSCRGRESHHQDQCEHERAGDVIVSSFHDFDSFELIILFIGSLLIDLVPQGGLRSMLILYDSPSRLSCAAGVARIRLQSSAFRKRWSAHFHLDRSPCDFSRFFSLLLAMQARHTRLLAWRARRSVWPNPSRACPCAHRLVWPDTP